MEVYIIAKRQSVSHGHGSTGTDLVMPIFDSYSNKYTHIPVYSTLEKAYLWLELNDPYNSYTVVPMELI